MLALFQFILPPKKNQSHRPLWEFQIIQFFYGSVYFFAGVSKISSSWLDGTITESMIENNGLVIPNILLYWGGFLLDFLGGIGVMYNCFKKIHNKVNIFIHSQFTLFHLHNLIYLFKSIQFFPLHMHLTPLVFWTKGVKFSNEESKFPKRLIIPIIIVLSQAILACRRFFILVDYPWQIMEANDIAEFHSQIHHFSWRMKSRTCATGLHAGGFYPMLMSIGIGPTNAEPEDVEYVKYIRVFYNKINPEAEAGIQPLINRVRRTMPKANPNEISVNLFWWAEINHHPYQLIVNPELNFVGATHIPFWEPPPKSHVENRVVPSRNWIDLARNITRDPRIEPLNVFPFISRSIPDKWVPNPTISSLGRSEMMPQYIACLYGLVVVRWDRTEHECGEGMIIDVRENPRFFLKFEADSMMLLAFKT